MFKDYSFPTTKVCWNYFTEKSRVTASKTSTVVRTALPIILRVGVCFSLFRLHPHGFTYSAIGGYFFSDWLKLGTDQIDLGFRAIFYNKTKWKRIVYGIPAAFILTLDIPDTLTIFTVYAGIKTGTAYKRWAEKNDPIKTQSSTK